MLGDGRCGTDAIADHVGTLELGCRSLEDKDERIPIAKWKMLGSVRRAPLKRKEDARRWCGARSLATHPTEDATWRYYVGDWPVHEFWNLPRYESSHESRRCPRALGMSR